MARTTQTRKRSGGPIRRTQFKKRRFVRRSNGRKTSQWTSQRGSGAGVGFSRKRTTRKQFRRQLWNSSMATTHYRSNNATTGTVTTPASAATMTTSIIASRRLGGNNFWLTAGGAVNPDGGLIPSFATATDITVRGGMYGIRLSNAPDALDVDKDSLSVIVYLVRTTKNWNSSALPATVNVGWDPSLVTDFQTNIGKVLFRKNFLLAEGEVMTIERRMYLQKIDQSEYSNSQSEMVWIVLAGNTSSGTTKNLLLTGYYNLSFVGDAV